jgi:hypothetical protein
LLNTRHPNKRGSAAIEAFLTHPAAHQKATGWTRKQELSAMRFLSHGGVRMPLNFPIDTIRAKGPKCLPALSTREEGHKVIDHLSGPPQLMEKLFYGGWLRLKGWGGDDEVTWKLDQLPSGTSVAQQTRHVKNDYGKPAWQNLHPGAGEPAGTF